jgi:anthranilate phosphoribosyltransferase
LKDGRIAHKELNPRDFGIEPADIEKLKVADAQTSARIVKDILSGRETGSGKDIVVLNASAAIIAGGLAGDFVSAIKLAQASIENGSAQDCLEKLIEVSNKA